ncbi:helix-turn-helix domain-containing protein [Thermophagus sp. OGC60D27]|uniref:helix-turn-helix domain-containing protein n=1 Tax=Thermophagus sp. OGC60D27 TaxID=3458415 RepID=UPI004038142D
MKDRLQEILRQENLTPARFAELVGVQRSSVSHILSGRNNPSLDFLQKILANFEHINPDWLISGKGAYKRSSGSAKSVAGADNMNFSGKILFPEKKEAKEEERAPYFRKKVVSPPPGDPNKHQEGSYGSTTTDSGGKTNSKRIVKTILFYDDNTFEVFRPA